MTKLWEKYFSRMVHIAFNKFGRHPCRSPDAEDVAISAFAHFCNDVAAGAFPWVKDRESLWPVLVTITARRAARLSRDELRLKRSARRRDDRTVHSLGLVSRSLPPDEAMLLEEQVEILLNDLESPLLRKVAKLKMEGLTTAEVAVEANIAVRSVERKLNLIRKIWLANGKASTPGTSADT
jgi:DNA-directed RNA polymerase specialized sigma24 family protein